MINNLKLKYNALFNKPEPWIQTFSGKKFKPLNADIEDICIKDIAHALSQICRFTGHCKNFYSVAEHSVHVSKNCDPKEALFGLLHDGSEAYLTDVSSPLKRSGKFEAYKKIEKKLQTLIYKKYCGGTLEPASVKIADTRMLATEARDLMSPLHQDWIQPAEPYLFKINGWSNKIAEKKFLDRFHELYNQV